MKIEEDISNIKQFLDEAFPHEMITDAVTGNYKCRFCDEGKWIYAVQPWCSDRVRKERENRD